jgi:hypothetical protein
MSSDPNFHDGFSDGLLVTGVEVRIFLRTVSQENLQLF